MKWAGVGLAGVLVMGLIGCEPRAAQSLQSTAPADANTQAAAKGQQTETLSDSPVLIVTIQSRDHSVKVYSDDRFTVQNTEGQLVAELVTGSEFKQLLPEVFADVNDALAENAWAGLNIGDDRAPSAVEQTRTREITHTTTTTTIP